MQGLFGSPHLIKQFSTNPVTSGSKWLLDQRTNVKSVLVLPTRRIQVSLVRPKGFNPPLSFIDRRSKQFFSLLTQITNNNNFVHFMG